MKYFPLSLLVSAAVLVACNQEKQEKRAAQDELPSTVKAETGEEILLPAPYDTKSVKNFSKHIGWPAGKTPTAPTGFVVTAYAKDFDSPRWTYVLPNGDVLVAEANTVPSTTTKKI